MKELENNTVTLVDEEGAEFHFKLVDMIEVEEQEYAILLPTDAEELEAVILKVVTDENGEEILTNIDDDEEWEMVASAWQAAMDEDEEDEEDEESEDQ